MAGSAVRISPRDDRPENDARISQLPLSVQPLADDTRERLVVYVDSPAKDCFPVRRDHDKRRDLVLHDAALSVGGVRPQSVNTAIVAF